MKRFLILVIVAGLVLGGWYIAKAGPLSSAEVTSLRAGVPTAGQVASCSVTSATASSALPQGSLIRLVPDGGSVYYDFTGVAGSTSLTTGHFLPQNTVEYVQNGANQWVACITTIGTASLSIGVMK